MTLFTRLASVVPFILPVFAVEPPPAKEDHSQHASAVTEGRKMEMIAGITAADFLRLGSKPNTVEAVVIAVFNDVNYGMNFNGFAKGGATYVIPKGWTVNVTYINPSPIPPSLIVIEKDSLKKLQVPEPYFKGAAIPDHLKGLAYGKSSFSFVADEAGDFAFACGFPSHAMNGHWIALEISADAKTPTLKLGDAAAVPASAAKAKE